MPKKPRVRTLMDSQYVKVSERLLKSARQSFVKFSDQSEGKSAAEISLWYSQKPRDCFLTY